MNPYRCEIEATEQRIKSLEEELRIEKEKLAYLSERFIEILSIEELKGLLDSL
jgi:hypothetical protein